MKQLVFIVNPVAGNGQAKKKWEEIKSKLEGAHEVFFTTTSGHAMTIAKELAEREQAILVVVIGGDGTIHEVLEGCRGYSHIEMTAVAAGSGNDFVRTFTAVRNTKDIEELRISTNVKPMRLGSLKTADVRTVFVNNAGFGFDAKVVYEANRSVWKKRLNRFGLGKVVYYGTVVKELISYQPTGCKLQVDDRDYSFSNVWFVVVCNQPYFGGGMKISPLSSPEDDLLEATVISDLSRWKLLLLFGTVFIGWHTKLKEVHQFSGSSIRIQTEQSLIGHVDGEYAGELQPDQQAICEILEETWAMPVK